MPTTGPAAPQPDDLAAWVRRVEQDLNGRSYASLFWHTLDGFAVAPLATRDDTKDLPHLAATALLRTRRGMAIRELVAVPTPERANERMHRALARGADEVELVLDVLAQDALEPSAEIGDGADDLLGVHLPGDGGVAIHDGTAFAAALEGVDLHRTSLWFTAGESALPVLAAWLRLADERGVPRAALRGGIDVDPIARLTCRRLGFVGDAGVASQRAAIQPVFEETVAALRTCRDHCPEVRPLVVDGQAFHLAGAPPAFEVGATLAAAIDVARRLGERGVDFAELAAGTTLRVQVSHQLLTEIAKLRALRLLWAKVASGFGADGDALVPRVLGVTSARFRAEEHDQRSNLVRTALAAFAATVGGCDSVVALPWIEGDDDDAADLARDQLHLLRAESHLERVADPAGGSFTIEKLTHEIGRAAWDAVHDVEKEGGFLAAARSGFLDERLQIAEDTRERGFRTRRRVLVGVSAFADPELGGAVLLDEVDRADELLERHARWRTERDASRAAAIVEAIGRASPERFFEHALRPDAQHASMAELATATWPPDGVRFEHRFAPVAAADGHEFETLRTRAATAREHGVDPVVLLLPFGDPDRARARSDFARDLLQVGGFTVVEAAHCADVAAAIAMLRARAPAAVVLCSADGAYPAMIEALAASDVPAGRRIVAGHLPDELLASVDATVRLGIDAVTFLDELQRALGVRDAGTDDVE